MIRQVQMRTISVFLSGVVVGVAAIVFLGDGRHQTTDESGPHSSMNFENRFESILIAATQSRAMSVYDSMHARRSPH